MARSEARIGVDIWDDDDFTQLGSDAQWMYFFLLSQNDLTHAGVIALRERRWARSAADLTAAEISRRLGQLAAANYVVIDEDTEEVLVRSLVRRDKVYRQPNVLRAAADSLSQVASQAIRQALANELARVADEDMPEGSRSIVAEMRAALPNPTWNPSGDPFRNPDPDQQPIDGNPTPGTPGVRGGVTEVHNDSPDPEPRSPYPVPRRTPPESETRASARNGRPEADPGRPATPSKGTRVPDDFEPDSDLVEWARQEAPTTSGADHEQFMDYWRSVPGAKGRKVDWRATWRNWMRREHERRAGNPRASPTTAPPRGSTTDQRVADALAAGARVQAQLDQQPPIREIAA